MILMSCGGVMTNDGGAPCPGFCRQPAGLSSTACTCLAATRVVLLRERCVVIDCCPYLHGCMCNVMEILLFYYGLGSATACPRGRCEILIGNCIVAGRWSLKRKRALYVSLAPAPVAFCCLALACRIDQGRAPYGGGGGVVVDAARRARAPALSKKLAA